MRIKRFALIFKTMFKSQCSLQTPLLVRLSLSAAIAVFFAGWSTSSDASTPQFTSPTMTLASKSVRLKNHHLQKELTQMVQFTHQEVNKYRTSLDLAPLKLSVLISKQAMIHSQNMAQQQVEFSHDGFQGRVAALENDIDYRGAAENVAYNMGYQNPVATAVAGWIKSDGHRKNMEGNYNLTGIGVAVNPQGEYYFTQIFILEN